MQEIKKLSKDQFDFLNMGTQVNTVNNEYYYLPFWFKKIDDKGNFEVLRFEKLPSDLIEMLNEFRMYIEPK
jgi:hypothetical protein